jgi:hypothetical protein
MPRQDVLNAIQGATVRRRRAARAFRPDGAGVYTRTVPGGLGYTYVRMQAGTGQSLSMAIDLIGLTSPTDNNKPIWIEPGPDGRWYITARRYEGS